MSVTEKDIEDFGRFAAERLKNGGVYKTLLPIIRQVKTRRQLIFVTHNPNIPVLGDSDKVFVLASDGNGSRIAEEGDVDACSDHIITLLEGGADAFRQRKERYGSHVHNHEC